MLELENIQIGFMHTLLVEVRTQFFQVAIYLPFILCLLYDMWSLESRLFSLNDVRPQYLVF